MTLRNRTLKGERMPSTEAPPSSGRGLRQAERLSAGYGPWAVITGASDGIGAACADLLAAAGLNVVLAARRVDPLERSAADYRARHGVEVVVVPCDLTTSSGSEALFAATAHLDVGLLVAAAGFATTGRFLDNDPNHELALVDLNCRAVVEAAHHYGRRFAERGRGGIVLFGSIVAFQGVPNTANYAASKAFVQSFAEGIRPELKAVGVDVLVSAPGPVATGFAARADMRMGSAAQPHDVARATLDRLGRRTTVRPGSRALILGSLLSTAPRKLRTIILTRIIGGFIAHQPQR